MNTMNRFLAVSAFVAVAAASQALSLNLISYGSYTLSSATSWTQNENVLVSQTGGLITPTTLALTVPGGGTGSAVYTDGSKTLTLDLLFTTFSYGTSGLPASTHGTWKLTTPFEGYVGDGTFSASYNDAGAFASTTLVGDLKAVPEPASMFALAGGALLLVARRKRA